VAEQPQQPLRLAVPMQYPAERLQSACRAPAERLTVDLTLQPRDAHALRTTCSADAICATHSLYCQGRKQHAANVPSPPCLYRSCTIPPLSLSDTYRAFVPALQQEGGGDDDDGGEYEEEGVEPSTKDLLVSQEGGSCMVKRQPHACSLLLSYCC
jgi:hypothetical protein